MIYPTNMGNTEVDFNSSVIGKDMEIRSKVDIFRTRHSSARQTALD